MTAPIYHLTTRAAWADANTLGEYTVDSQASLGFIHCSTASQVLRVANAYYPGCTDLVLLEIDTSCLRAEVRWEPGTDRPEELFPHIYGPLNLQAVSRVFTLSPEVDGQFKSLPV